MIDISTGEVLYGLTPPPYKPEKDTEYCMGCIYDNMGYCDILQEEVQESTQDICRMEGRRHRKDEK